MDASTCVVIKVKYGDMLRRFSARIVDNKLSLSIGGLREKIISFFSFAPDSELILTYIDEDGDVVTLVDDYDLGDVVKQGLDPLRITVKLNAETSRKQYVSSSENSTPSRTPAVSQPPLQSLLSGVPNFLETVPQPLRETLVKLSSDLASKTASLSSDLASKTASSAPGVSDLVDHLSKMCLSYLGQLSDIQPGIMPSGTHGAAATETKDSEVPITDDGTLKAPSIVQYVEQCSKNNKSMEKPEPEAINVKDQITLWRITEGGEHTSPKAVSFSEFASAVAVAFNSMNVDDLPGNDISQNSSPVHPEAGIVSDRNSEKEKVPKMVKCDINGKSRLPIEKEVCSISTEEEVDKHNGLTVGLSPASVTAPSSMKGEYFDNGKRSVLPVGFAKSPGPIGAPSSDGLNIGGSFSGPNPMYECPFSGIAIENVSATPPDALLRRTISQKDSGNIFHHGVQCDGCGVHPITGPRFKSKVKVDYDLCRVCFQEMGSYSDYTRIDRPLVYRHHMSSKGLHAANARDQGKMLPHVYRAGKVKSGASKLDSRFIQDVNVIDGTVMAPLTPFTKIWRMRNNGRAVWPPKTQLVWIGGDKLSDAFSVEVEIPANGVMIDEELDIAVDFIAPERPGHYISHWRMASPSGQKFGQHVWVLIQVDAAITEMPVGSIGGLNLNLPPVSSYMCGPEIFNVSPDSVVAGCNSEPDNWKKIVELVQPVIDSQPITEHELNFPINDSLLVGCGASNSPPVSPYVSYPTVDLPDIAATISFPLLKLPTPPPPAPVASVQETLVELPAKEHGEEKLLRELEEMGFKQVDLNKEILRLNEYDLEQAVDDLCGVTEWDPMLDELHEMGFNDTAKNKMLLKKNNGSIKHVVMDLIAGESYIK